MAQSTLGQLAVGTSAKQFTGTTGQSLQGSYGINISIPTTGKVYYAYTSSVTTGSGFYIPTAGATISPADVTDPSTLYFISDTAAQVVCYEIVGKTITVT